jgi:class 3 adenylate cyclase
MNRSLTHTCFSHHFNSAFDLIAKKLRVFKVEVVGDCYVAVCGLPDPRKDHAVAMVKFAVECVKEMNRVTQRLEIDLGPETADLKLRVGLHSGPVVAGVLRGDKSRFQLFGDTMNTASRMESTGIPNMVQISQETAALLEEAGKKHWFEPRKEMVEAKGKGTLRTFFLVAGKGDRQSWHTGRASSSASLYDDTCTDSDASSLGTFRDDEEKIEKRDRIANWTAIVMLGLLREIEARRIAAPAKKSTEEQLWKLEHGSSYHENGDTVINEVAEIIELPKFNAAATKHEARVDVDDVVLPESVCRELKEFVGTIAGMYHQNRKFLASQVFRPRCVRFRLGLIHLTLSHLSSAFHNFPHANHVTMSGVKLLSRIKAPDVADIEGTTLHDHTYGITSDPLTRFAVVL